METDILVEDFFNSVVPLQRTEEHQLLEESILKNGFDPAYPIIVWGKTIIDGHNRYEICTKHNIPFTTSEKFFDNEHDVINWIIDNQLSRRNITDDQRAYLIGKRYKEEKKAIGENKATDDVKFMKELSQRQLSNDERAYLVGKRYAEEKKGNNIKKVPQCEVTNLNSSFRVPTSFNIAEQHKVSHATVKRAEKFADAVDKVAENTGINPQEILSYIL